MRRTITWILAALGVLCLASAQSQAEDWKPTRPIKMICPFPAGGGTDQIARIVALQLSNRLGQQVYVENRGGANGGLGAQEVMRAEPDGYTIGAISDSPMTVNPWMYDKLAYRPLEDFIPVARINHFPSLLVANPSVPVKTVADLIKLAKEKPGQLNFASSGSGTSIHLSGELFKTMAGVDMMHVPYKGSAPAVTDLMGGQVQLMFDNLPSSLAQIKAGKLRAIAVTSAQRAPALPNIPTIAESGLPGFEASSWFGLLAPAGTPAAVVARINAEVNQWLQTAEAKATLLAQGAIPAGGTSEQFAAHIRAETEKWAKVVKVSGAKVD